MFDVSSQRLTLTNAKISAQQCEMSEPKPINESNSRQYDKQGLSSKQASLRILTDYNSSVLNELAKNCVG